MTLVVDIQIACSDDTPSEEALMSWADAAWPEDNETEVTLRIVGPEESRSLNSRYRDKDKPTNVLSFPFECPQDCDIPLLGDIVICAEIVEQEALEQNKNLTSHWAHMVIHGMLHLQGYDHVLEQEAEVMENLETKLITRLGFPPPYDEDKVSANQ